jgi:hypothetical protein
VLFALSADAVLAQSGAPDIIPFQGYLTDDGGDPVTDGTYAITFKLYTVSGGGSAIWTEAHTGGNEVQVTDGVFDVLLGSIQSLSGITFEQQLYLGITVESDSEISPRTQLGSAPYALAMRDVYSESNDVIVSTNLGIGGAPNRELTIGDIDASGGTIMNITAANRELLIGVNPSTGALVRGMTDNNLNLGANGADHLTVRSDGDIRVHEHLMVATQTRRGLITMRGPDDPVSGPVLLMYVTDPNQVESGRIRFAEAGGSWLGAFIHYDGDANLLRIGTHNVADENTGSDLDAITIGRSSRDVTIHEDLLAQGRVLKDYGDGSFTPTTVFGMGVIDASANAFDYKTANVLGLVKTTGGSGYYTVYFDESCPTSNARVPYVTSITMYDSGVDDISADPVCRSSVSCGALSRCVTVDIRPYNLLGFEDGIDLQFALFRIQ